MAATPRLHAFVPNDLVPRTGTRDADTNLIGPAIAAGQLFGTVRIPHPAQERFIKAFDRARLMGVASGSARKFAIACLAPSGSGKTTGIETFASRAALNRPIVQGLPGAPVVHVPVDNGCTNRRLWALVLEAHYDPPGRGTEETFRSRAYVTMRRAGTEMVVFDEVQHLLRSPSARDVTDTIKRILDDGVVSLGLVGTLDALPLIQKNVQLANRMIAPASLAPLDARSAADRADFASFLLKLDNFMVANGIFTTASGLHDARIVRCLFVISNGVIGIAVNLLRQAVINAVERGACRIEPFDLSKVTENWALPTNVCAANPFPMIFHGQVGIKV